MWYQSEKQQQIRQLAGCGFGAAIVIAPFIALLYDLVYGIAVMVIALLLTAWLAWVGADDADPERQRRLRALTFVNLLFATLGVVVIVTLLR